MTLQLVRWIPALLLGLSIMPSAYGQWENNYVILSTFSPSNCYLSGVTYGSCSTYGSAICQDSGGVMVSNSVWTSGCLADLLAYTYIEQSGTGIEALASINFLTTGFAGQSRHVQYCNGYELWEDWLPGSAFSC